MLFISRSIDLWKIICISSLYSIEKLSFLAFFYLQLLPLAPIIFFHFSTPFISFNGIIKKQCLLIIWPIQLAFLSRMLFRSVLFSPIHSRTCSFTFCDHLIFSILLQHHISKLFNYFCSNFLSVQYFNHNT